MSGKFPLQYENWEDRYKYLPNRIITYQEVYKFMKKISPPTRYKGIKFKIDDPLWEKFNQIKDDLGMANDSEVIRYLITQYAKRYES